MIDHSGKHGFNVVSRMKSFAFAWRGLTEIIRSQYNFRIHIAVAMIVILLGFTTCVSYHEWLAIIIVIGFVLFAEAINTALEYLVDLISPEYHELAGKVKDIAAGAVLIAVIIAVMVGLIIFIPKLI
ncbi:MAG: diacylglycerol kinase family protein [Bacteroidota bacterium]